MVTRNTLLYNLAFIALGTIGSLALALMLYEFKSRRVIKTYQTVLFIPYFLSWIAISYVLYAFLNPELGVLNNLFERLGLPYFNWYFDPKYWPVILVASYLWKWMGYYTILYYTGLLSIDYALYEAASIDGASKLQQVFAITLPMLSPLITILVLLQVGRIFNSDFGIFYFLPRDSGMLYSATDVIDTYTYRALRTLGNVGMASAIGLYQAVVGFVVVLLANHTIKKINSDSAIF